MLTLKYPIPKQLLSSVMLARVETFQKQSDEVNGMTVYLGLIALNVCSECKYSYITAVTAVHKI
jgi:hypothetical protein